jgi:hypothetical protein
MVIPSRSHWPGNWSPPDSHATSRPSAAGISVVPTLQPRPRSPWTWLRFFHPKEISMNTNTQPSEAIDTQRKLEAEIADFLRQRIEDGNLDAEDIPVRLARYGLMAPEAFLAEMRERMGIDDEK